MRKVCITLQKKQDLLIVCMFPTKRIENNFFFLDNFDLPRVKIKPNWFK